MFWAAPFVSHKWDKQEESEQDLQGSLFNLLCLLSDYCAQCRRRITLLVVFSDKSLSVKFFRRICSVSCTPPSLLISTPDAQTALSKITGRLSEHSISIMKSKCLLHKLKKKASFCRAISKKKKFHQSPMRLRRRAATPKRTFHFHPAGLKGSWERRRCGGRHFVGGLESIFQTRL